MEILDKNMETLFLEAELLFLYKYYKTKDALNKQLEQHTGKLNFNQYKLDELTKERQYKQNQIERVNELNNFIEEKFLEGGIGAYNILSDKTKDAVDVLHQLYLNSLFSTEYFNGQSVYSLFNGPKNSIDLVVIKAKKDKKKLLCKQTYTQETQTYSIVDTGSTNMFARLNYLLKHNYLKAPSISDEKKMVYLNKEYSRYTFIRKHYICINQEVFETYNITKTIPSQSKTEVVKETKYTDLKDYLTIKDMYFDFFGHKIPICTSVFSTAYSEEYDFDGNRSLYVLYRLGEVINKPEFKKISFDMYGKPSFSGKNGFLPHELLLDLFPFNEFIFENEFFDKDTLKKELIEERIKQEGLWPCNVHSILSKDSYALQLRDFSSLERAVSLGKKKVSIVNEELENVEQLKKSKRIKIIPNFYRDFESISKLTFLYLNKRANNITDLINVYEQTKWQNKVLDSLNQLHKEMHSFEQTVVQKLNTMNQNLEKIVQQEKLQNAKLDEINHQQLKQNDKLDDLKNIELYNANQLYNITNGIKQLDNSVKNVKKAIDELEVDVHVSTNVDVNIN